MNCPYSVKEIKNDNDDDDDAMVDQPKAFTLISSWDQCQKSSLLRISKTPQAGFKPVQSLSLALVEWSCTVVIPVA